MHNDLSADSADDGARLSVSDVSFPVASAATSHTGANAMVQNFPELHQAFETIRHSCCFDAFTAVPHPDNLLFQMEQEHRFMHRLGMHLVDLVGDRFGEDLQYAAHTVRRHFWKELGLPHPPKLTSNVPRFLLQPDHKISPRTDPVVLAHQLAAVPMSQTPVLCIVASKLALLQKLLHLSGTAIKFLRLAYVNSSMHSLGKDESSGIKMALSSIGVADTLHRNRAVAVLLDTPLAAVEAMFVAPSSLVALRFVDAAIFNRNRTLRDAFALTDEFVTLLETPYRSHAAVLAGILEPEQDMNLLYDQEIPVGYLYEILPREIAEAFECAVLDRPLKSIHIQALVRWYTGGHDRLPSSYSPLAGHITVEAVRDAIKHAALACCQANKPLDSHALLKALYAAST